MDTNRAHSCDDCEQARCEPRAFHVVFPVFHRHPGQEDAVPELSAGYHSGRSGQISYQKITVLWYLIP